MSVTLTPAGAPPPKKRGVGCLGCGLIVLGLLTVLVLALVLSVAYAINSEAVSITSTEPTQTQTFDGGDDMYNAARQKLTDFDHDLHAHLAATIHLSADEINTLIARNPDFTKNNIHLFVTIKNGEADTLISIPTDLFAHGYWLKGRYFNGEGQFSLDLDSTTKMLTFDLEGLQINGKELPKDNLPLVQTELTPTLNQMVNNSPEGKMVLQQAKSIGFKDNELVIEIQ